MALRGEEEGHWQIKQRKMSINISLQNDISRRAPSDIRLVHRAPRRTSTQTDLSVTSSAPTVIPLISSLTGGHPTPAINDDVGMPRGQASGRGSRRAALSLSDRRPATAR
jgi:hypothetical protein